MDEKIDSLFEPVLQILRAHPDGISEHDLLRALDGAGVDGFDKGQIFASELSLFQTHFLLFHVLYRLRDRLLEERRGALQIHFLRIVIRPYGLVGTADDLPEPSDDLRGYYLDLDNLDTTTGADVRELLDRFWRRFARYEASGGSGGCRQALAVLGLEEGVEADTIRLRYRRLVMEHHPDRGGDTERLQEINAAMARLREEMGV